MSSDIQKAIDEAKKLVAEKYGYDIVEGERRYGAYDDEIIELVVRNLTFNEE